MASRHYDSRAYILGEASQQFHSLKVINEGKFSVSAVGSQRNGPSVFVKCFYGEGGLKRGLAEHSAMLRAWRYSTSVEVFNVPEPFDFFPINGHGGILHAELIKMNRGDLWFKWFANFRSLKNIGLWRTASWLSCFHGLETLSAETETLMDLVDSEAICEEIESAKLRTDVLGRKWPNTSTLFRDRFESFRSFSVSCGLIHNDFTPSNTFIGLKTAVGFDFTLEEQGPIYRDVANFLVSLLWVSRPLIGPFPLGSLLSDKAAFISAYGETAKSLDSKILDLFIVESLIDKRRHLEMKREGSSVRGKIRTSTRHIEMIDQLLPVFVCSMSKEMT
jgi:hypothetical protein